MLPTALRVLAPAIFLFALTGVFRGFFQGRSTMVPTAASQVIEQVVNAIVSLAAAFVFVGYGTKLGEKKETTAWALLTALQAERLEP